MQHQSASIEELKIRSAADLRENAKAVKEVRRGSGCLRRRSKPEFIRPGPGY
jgi:hypothetical protein